MSPRVKFVHGGKSVQKEISDRTWRGTQSWNRERIVVLTSNRIEHRLRFTIKRDAYDAQGYAKVEVWTDGAWSEIERLSGHIMASRLITYVDPTVKPAAFDADLAELLRVAIGVLDL